MQQIIARIDATNYCSAPCYCLQGTQLSRRRGGWRAMTNIVCTQRGSFRTRLHAHSHAMTKNCSNVTTGTAPTQPDSGAASSDQGPSTSAVPQIGSKRVDKSQDGKHARMQRLSAGFQAMLKLVSALNLFGFKAPQVSIEQGKRQHVTENSL